MRCESSYGRGTLPLRFVENTWIKRYRHGGVTCCDSSLCFRKLNSDKEYSILGGGGCVWHLVTCDDDDRILKNANVFVRDGVIEYIGNEAIAADEVIDGTGMVMYPGLINTHHHLYQTFSRNLPEVQNMELFPWLKYLYEIWKNLDEKVVYYSSLTGMGELLKTGCTTCLDHHYVFPEGTGDRLMDAQFAAADALGMRFHATRGSMDLSV